MIKVAVRVKTSSRSGVDIVSLDPPFLQVKTSKPLEKGLANRDIIAQLAEYLNCPKSHISIVVGHTSRKKLVELPLNEKALISILKQKEYFLL